MSIDASLMKKNEENTNNVSLLTLTEQVSEICPIILTFFFEELIIIVDISCFLWLWFKINDYPHALMISFTIMISTAFRHATLGTDQTLLSSNDIPL